MINNVLAGLSQGCRDALASANRVREEIARQHAGRETIDVTTWENVPMDRW